MAVFLAAHALAQEAIRPSVVGEAAAELRKKTPLPTNYNLEIGPVLLNASGGISVQFNDNINLSASHPEADLIVSPTVSINLTWPVTKTNVLTFATSIGYRDYLFHPQRTGSDIEISPNSQLSFDIYTGDFRINLHDQFSVTDNPINQGDLNNVTSYPQFTNTIGVGVLWDLQAVILSLGLDHTNVITGTPSGNTTAIPDNSHATESASLSAFVPLTAVTSVGVNTSLAYTTYSQSDRGTATVINFGPYLQTRLTRYTQLDLSAGYQSIQFRGQGVGQGAPVGSVAPSNGGVGGYYASVSVTHQLNRFYSDSLSFGRESQLGIVSDQQEYYFLNYGSQWRLGSKITLGTSIAFQDVSQSGSISSQHFDQLLASINTSYLFTRKLEVSASYQFTLRLADVANQGYVQNALTLAFAYSF